MVSISNVVTFCLICFKIVLGMLMQNQQLVEKKGYEPSGSLTSPYNIIWK
jgi:hypothetical protein